MGTAIEKMGPVLEAFKDLECSYQTNASHEEIDNKMSKLRNELSYYCLWLPEYEEKVERIKNSNIELEEKINNLNELLDKSMKKLSLGDWESNLADCQETYKDFWDKLDANSKKYLTMAQYLYRLIENRNMDYSPAVLEFGRTIENELVIKIFDGFIVSVSDKKSLLIDMGKRYEEMKKAISDYRNDRRYYLPAMKMVRYLENIADRQLENDYNEALKSYMDNNGIDKTKLSEKIFTSKAEKVFEKRNKAAHQGTTINQESATKCRKNSDEVLRIFMDAINS